MIASKSSKQEILGQLTLMPGSYKKRSLFQKGENEDVDLQAGKKEP